MSVHELKVKELNQPERIDIYLSEHLADIPSRSFLKKMFEQKLIQVNGRLAKANTRVDTDDIIVVNQLAETLPPEELTPENIPLDIFYEDEYLLVVNKAEGMVVHPAAGIYTGTLVNALLYHCKELSDFSSPMRPGIVHRLDQGTSGLMLIAKNNITHTKLMKQFKQHKIQKQYAALVEGLVEFDSGEIDAPIGRDPRNREKKKVIFDEDARESYTQYFVKQRYKTFTHVNLVPKTGRTHQLRVHMSYLKHPILGDKKYGNGQSFSRLALHAQSLAFTHPETRSFMEFKSILPEIFTP